MPTDIVPSNAAEAYRLIIDELVKHTDSLSARLVESEGTFTRATGHETENGFVNRLNREDRSALARMLSMERRSAFHDVLAELSAWVTCRHVALTYKDKPMSVDLSGMGLHGDYIGRLDDWAWPTENE